MARFDGKVAIVTGASQGLGPVMAKMLVAEGAKVVISARRFELVKAVADEIGEAAVAVQADVTVEADVAAMVDAAMTRWGQVDVLMNNAAAPGKDLHVWENTLENWNATIATDVTAAFLCSREVLKRSMIERKTGVILNFSSSAGWRGLPRKSHYSVAKAGLRVLSKVIAMEAGPYNVRCNCVVPGIIMTELLAGYLKRIAGEQGTTEEAVLGQLMAHLPIKRTSTPEDVARFALFLASDEARTITGQSMNVDAGDYMVG
jgi:NAD(P)-dependent dehydrogenase (short-subunit alcohol dehydrogenase family)